METPERKTFMAFVTGNTLAVSRDKKTPSVKIKVQTQYETCNVSVPFIETIYGDLWLTFAALDKTKKTLQEVFGWKGTSISDFAEPFLVGKKVEVVCDKEEWEGDERWSIAFFNRPGGMRGAEGEDLVKLIADVQPLLNESLGLPQTEQDASGGDSDVVPEPGPQPAEDDLPDF